MEDLNYEIAQAYYDSALVYIPDDNERKEDITSLASNLTDLVLNLRTIEEQDSLLALCDLNEFDRRRVIENFWEDMADDLERRKEEMEAANEAAIAEAGSVGVGMFWPYNGALLVGGRQNYNDYWGDRVLEDHWRRSRKLDVLFSNDEETESEESEEYIDPYDPASLPTVDEMLEDLPCGEEERANSLALLAEAYYLAGLDYREKLVRPRKRNCNLAGVVRKTRQQRLSPDSNLSAFQNVFTTRA